MNDVYKRITLPCAELQLVLSVPRGPYCVYHAALSATHHVRMTLLSCWLKKSSLISPPHKRTT